MYTGITQFYSTVLVIRRHDNDDRHNHVVLSAIYYYNTTSSISLMHKVLMITCINQLYRVFKNSKPKLEKLAGPCLRCCHLFVNMMQKRINTCTGELLPEFSRMDEWENMKLQETNGWHVCITYP